MANIGSYLPSPGSAVWRRDVASPAYSNSAGAGSRHLQAVDSSRVRHVVIRDAEIWEEPAPYVVYRISVMTEKDHWYLFRRYSQFHSLHKKLVKQYGVNKDLLPPKKISGNLSQQLIDKRRKLLEGYLQKIVHSEPQVSRSPELQVFLDTPTHDVVKVTDILTKHLYQHGDKLLQEATPIALSVNEMYAITRRLQLPRDATGLDPDDLSSDPAHLYSFVHQLERLRISRPPAPCSVSCTIFDLGCFRSLHTLKLDQVPMSQVGGLVLIQQQLLRLSVHNSLHTLHELLVEAAEERRSGDFAGSDSPGPRSSSNSMEGWRLSATAKLVGTRVVVKPWGRLHTLTLSHNSISQLDNSLQVLPALRELTLSYNQLKVLNLQYLCLPSLEKLNLSHNKIHTIQDNKKVLERITHLSLSHNRLSSLNGIGAFVGVCVINLAFNLISSGDDLSKLVKLRRLNTLSMAGNPVSGFSGYRIVLLAKFLFKSKTLSIDGLEATSKEQAKIKSYRSKYGSNPDQWPIAKSLYAHESSHSRYAKSHPIPKDHHPGSTTPTSPHIDLSWQIQHDGDFEPRLATPTSERHHNIASASEPRLPSRPTSARSDRLSWDRFSFPSTSNDSLEQDVGDPRERTDFSTPQLSRGRNYGGFSRGPDKRPFSSSFSGAMTEERFSVGGNRLGGAFEKGQGKGYAPRSEPDGQSDISSTSPDMFRQRRSPYHSVLSTPPCTPITDSKGTSAAPITPAMLQSALDALEGIPDKATPLSHHHSLEAGQNPVLPGAVTNALTKWISSQSLQGAGSVSGGPSRTSLKTTPLLTTPLLTPPPSTPETASVKSVSFEHAGGKVSAGISAGISAGDLITALSTLKVSGEGPGSGGSGGPAVPVSTPNEGVGGLEEWARLGIKPAAVIQALSALTIQQETQEAQKEEEEEDGHRVCAQVKATPSPLETTPSPPPHHSETEPASFLCLFPESTTAPPPATPSSFDSHGSQSSFEHEMGAESTGHVEEADFSLNLADAQQGENEFAELDPFLSPSHDALQHYHSFEEQPYSQTEAEVGIDVAIATETLGPTFLGTMERNESSSPPESVLYS